MHRFTSKLIACLILVWAALASINTASAVIIRPAVSGLPGVSVTPGFSMSFYVPQRVFFGLLPNPDYPTNPNDVGIVEQFLEQPAIIGRDVVHVGKGQANKKKNPVGRIFFVEVKNWGILTFFYPTVINNFVVSLPSYVTRVNNLQWEVFDLADVLPPPPPAVPVPAPVFLLMSGLGGLAALKRRQKKLN